MLYYIFSQRQKAKGESSSHLDLLCLLFLLSSGNGEKLKQTLVHLLIPPPGKWAHKLSAISCGLRVGEEDWQAEPDDEMLWGCVQADGAEVQGVGCRAIREGESGVEVRGRGGCRTTPCRTRWGGEGERVEEDQIPSCESVPDLDLNHNILVPDVSVRHCATQQPNNW